MMVNGGRFNMNNIVSFDIDGCEIEGVITLRTACDIVVEMIKPYVGLSECRHMMHLVAMSDRSYRKDFGIETAIRLLREMYQKGKAIEDNFEELHQMYKSFDKNRSYLKIITRKEELAKEIQSIKEARLSGLISNKEAAMKIQPLRNEEGRCKKDMATFKSNALHSVLNNRDLRIDEIEEIASGKKNFFQRTNIENIS